MPHPATSRANAPGGAASPANAGGRAQIVDPILRRTGPRPTLLQRPPGEPLTSGAPLDYSWSVSATRHPGEEGSPAVEARGRRASPLSLGAIYLVGAFAWIALAHRAIDVVAQDGRLEGRLHVLAEVLFVLVSGTFLFLLLWRREERMRRLGEELHATLDSLGDGVLVVDRRGRIVEVNRAVTELTGIAARAEHLVPAADWARRVDLRGRDGAPVPAEEFAPLRALRGERPGPMEAQLRRTDGTDLPVSITASAVLDRAGRPRLAVGVLRDLSEAHRLAQTREELLATAAHEFKTPLSVIKAHAQLLQKRPGPEPGLQVIVRQVDRLTRLVQQILDSSRLRLDTAELRWERLDLTELAGGVVADLGPRPAGHPVTFEGRAGTWVRADRDRLTRVITALVDNALRFSPAEGPVSVRVGARGGEAIFSVLDHGVGIPPERQDRVFERYYRAHSDAPDDRGGLGVGLDAAREIIARHGGRMWFQSEPGTGSTFLFALPLAPEETAP